MKNILRQFKRHLVISTLLLLCTAVALSAVEQVSQWEWKDVPKVVAVGDVHGMLHSVKEILRRSKLVDEQFRWKGGESHIVFCGDLIGRGDYEKDVLDLIIRLEPEALEAGGRVHVILGNHDVMNMARDWRYVKERNFEDFMDVEKLEDRTAAWQEFQTAHANLGASESQLKQAFADRYPLGYFGRIEAFSLHGTYGSWLSQKPAVIKINDIIFVHGGLTPEFAKLGIEGINQDVQKTIKRYFELRDILEEGKSLPFNNMELMKLVEMVISGELQATVPKAYADSAAEMAQLDELKLFDEDGPFWYRDLALDEELNIYRDVDAILETLDTKHIVVAHTPSRFGRVSSRYEGKFYRIDVGMVYNERVWGFLIFDGSGFKTLGFQNPEQLVIPISEPPEGQDFSGIMEQLPPRQMEKYLKKAEIISVYREADPDYRNIVIYETDYKEHREKVAFQSVSQAPDSQNPQSTHRHYKHMVAAYRISRLLEMQIVPPAIIRKVDGREGAFILFPGKAVNKPMLEFSEKLEQALQGMEEQLSDARAFLALIDNDMAEHLDQGKMLLRREKRILLADLTKAFSESPGLQEEFLSGEAEWKLEIPIGAFLELKLRELNRKELRKEVKGLLTDAQVDALLGRRDRLLEFNETVKNR